MARLKKKKKDPKNKNTDYTFTKDKGIKLQHPINSRLSNIYKLSILLKKKNKKMTWIDDFWNLYPSNILLPSREKEETNKSTIHP